ncbi:MAG: hypothetical protein R6V58_10300 [Planctomycetota bacterium]
MCPTKSFFSTRALAGCVPRKVPVREEPPAAAIRARPSRRSGGFRGEKPNAHFYFNAGDSSTRPGDMYAWRYQKGKK